MNNELQIFQNVEFGKVRTVMENDVPYFCLRDVCECLDLQTTAVTRRLDDGVTSNHPIIDSMGRQQFATFINEDGLYDVILESRKPIAKRFRKWLTHDVIPTIRRTGKYDVNNSQSMSLSLPKDYLSALKALVVAEEQKQQLILSNRELEHENDSLNFALEQAKPKITYLDTILSSKSCVTVTQIAQDYGLTPAKFNSLLKNLHIQHKVSNQWILTAKHLQEGYVQSRTITIKQTNGVIITKLLTEWTQKGRMFLYDTLKRNNILPLIEKEQTTLWN
jgi:anti-repressor protein